MSGENKKLINIIGIGMVDGLTLTEAAREAITDSDAIFGSERVVEPFDGLEKPLFKTWDSAEIAEIIHRKEFERPCVLVSGDCGFYSAAIGMAEKLEKKLDDYETALICGISTPVYFSSKIKIPWQDMKFISLHGEENNVIRPICRNKHCFFLLGGDITAGDICGALCEFGLGDIKVYIGEDLGYATEKISVGSVREFANRTFEKLCVLVTENNNFERGIPIGIPDDEFVRKEVPMTKSEVRAVIMSKLGVGDGDICWDIGCGTGSVTVEMALNCGSGMVYAVDISDTAADLTSQNCKKFRCDNAFVYCGKAPNVLEDFTAPDCVFVGGSGGKFGEILEVVFKTAKSGARIVVTAVTLDTLERCRRAFSDNDIAAEIVQAAFSRVGDGSMMSALNPIFIIKGIIP